MRGLGRIVSITTLVVALASPSVADPIAVQINAGTLEMAAVGGTLAISGDHGFSLISGVGIIGGVFGPDITCSPCIPGDVISPSATWGGNDLHGTATFQGETYTQLGSLVPGHANGVVTFTGPSLLAPPFDGLTATLITPFGFTGSFFFPATGGNPDLSATLTGSGTASIRLFRGSLEIPWDYANATYTFDAVEPVPEPTTMLLVGSALAGLAAGRRRLIRRR